MFGGILVDLNCIAAQISIYRANDQSLKKVKLTINTRYIDENWQGTYDVNDDTLSVDQR